MEEMKEEQWLPVVGFKAYSVSDLGRVKRVVGGQGARCGVLTPVLNPSGYYQVRMCVKGKMHARLVARLVAAAFIGELPPNMEVNHIDGCLLYTSDAADE